MVFLTDIPIEDIGEARQYRHSLAASWFSSLWGKLEPFQDKLLYLYTREILVDLSQKLIAAKNGLQSRELGDHLNIPLAQFYYINFLKIQKLFFTERIGNEILFCA